MPVQSGSYPLLSGVVDYVVPFPAAFTSPPQIVIADVGNTSADATKYLLEAKVIGVTTSTFTVRLSAAPNTANYTLSWIAGGSSDILSVLQYTHRFFHEMAKQDTFADQDRLVAVAFINGIPRVRQALFQDLDTRWTRRRDVPTSPTVPDALAGDVAVDSDYVYVHDGAEWLRAPVVRDSDWAADYTLKPSRRGLASLTPGQVVQSITFDSPFTDGAAPVVRICQVQNFGAAAEKLLITALPVSTTLSGFTVVLNAEPDTSDYDIYYEVVQM